MAVAFTCVVTIVYAAVLLSGWFARSKPPAAPDGQNISMAASFPDSFDYFRDSLQKSDGRFLLNGIWHSVDSLRAVWDSSRHEITQTAPYELSLNVNLVNGALDYWADRRDRRLTYAIDRRSMSEAQYGAVKDAMAEAANDWEQACPQCDLAFVHLPEFDGTPSFDKVRFIIKHGQDNPGVATAFFPGTPADQRFIVVGPTFFDAQTNRAGVMRHTLGHVLGYRHEHITPEAGPGCPTEAPTFLTGSYDSLSVMHYRCGNGGTSEMTLSDRDIASHQFLYGVAAVQLEVDGQQVLRTAAMVLNAVAGPYTRLKLWPADTRTASGCRDYVAAAGLADELPKEGQPQTELSEGCFGFAARQIIIDGKPRVPLLRFRPTTDFESGFVSLDDADGLRRLDDLLKRVRTVSAKVAVDAVGKRYSVEWRKYETYIHVGDEELARLLPTLDALEQPGIRFALIDSLSRNVEVRRTAVQNSVLPVLSAASSSAGVSAALSQGGPGISAGPATVPPATPFSVKNPAEFQEICRPGGNSFGHYAALYINGDSNDNYTWREVDGQPYPELSCQDPDAICKNSAKGQVCQGPGCKECESLGRGNPYVGLIEESIDTDALSPPAGERSAQKAAQDICQWEDMKPEYHGTHMAGIMVGRNRFAGIASGLKVDPIRRSIAGLDGSLPHDIEKRARDHERGVVVLASQLCWPKALAGEIKWPDGTERPWCELPGDISARHNEITTSGRTARIQLQARHAPTREIIGTPQWLWVAAIGQPRDAGVLKNARQPDVFTGNSIATPATLAEQPHVLLVTTCEHCSVDPTDLNGRDVWSRAHVGRRSSNGDMRPHLAAPGGIDYREKRTIDGIEQEVGGLPGVAPGSGKFTRANGTSQAAAYVGGVAARMLACYPHFYKDSWRLKEALQSTSAPIVSEGDDRVATGLLDVRTALFHPSFHHFKHDGDWHRVHWKNEQKLKWCGEPGKPLTFVSAIDGSRREFNPADIRRIVKVSNDPLRWIVYAKGNELGKIDRSEWIAQMQGDAPLLFYDGQPYGLDGVDDLVIFTSLLFDDGNPPACKLSADNAPQDP
jgi:hypothetical protein